MSCIFLQPGRGSPRPVPELIAYAKANPGKITIAPPFSVCAAVAPIKLEDLKERDQQLEPLRAEQRKALEKHGRGLSARSIRSATSGANSINKSCTKPRRKAAGNRNHHVRVELEV
jgi:hypothetical protein